MVSSIGYSLGIGSGLDITTLVNNLAAAEKAPKEALIKRREDANAAKISALAEASGAIDSFAADVAGLDYTTDEILERLQTELAPMLDQRSA